MNSNFSESEVYIDNLGDHLLIYYKDELYSVFKADQINGFAFIEELDHLPPEFEYLEEEDNLEEDNFWGDFEPTHWEQV